MSTRNWTVFLFHDIIEILDVKLKVFKRDDNKDFPLVQNITVGEADFKQFMRLRNHLVIAAQNFGREENLSSVVISKMFKDMDEQLNLAHKVVDVVDRANRRIGAARMRGDVDETESSYAQVRFFARKKAVENFDKLSL